MKTYTFRISIPDMPSTWRTVELASQQTLRDLHVAIQEALDWDPDDDMAFFVGEDPLGGGEQYTLDFEDDWDDDAAGEDDLSDQDIEQLVEDLPPLDLGDTPRPQSMQEMLDLLESDADVRAQVSRMLTEQLGVPSFMVNMLLSNAKSLFAMMPEGMLAEMAGGGPEAKDAAAASLESLGLAPGQSLVYVFGEDDWRFDVRVESANEQAEDDALYPLILDGDGPAPQQYFDEDDDDDEGAWLWGDDEEDEDDFAEED
jgi:hypothetical protein